MPSGHVVDAVTGTDEVIFEELFVDAAVVFLVIAGAAVAIADAAVAMAAGAVVASGAALIAPAVVFFFEVLQYGATAVPFALV